MIQLSSVVGFHSPASVTQLNILFHLGFMCLNPREYLPQRMVKTQSYTGHLIEKRILWHSSVEHADKATRDLLIKKRIFRHLSVENALKGTGCLLIEKRIFWHSSVEFVA